MHSRLEIIMPPTTDVNAAVTEILAPFDENGSEDSEPNTHAFWDFWVIGGRYAGSKLEERLDPEKLKAFHAKIAELKVTVSGLQCGKQSLQPISQIPMVDALWVEFFPESGQTVCPLFAHSNDQYSSESLISGDVCTLAELPPSSKCSHLIIAGPDYADKGLQAHYMLQDSIWNGVTHVKAQWTGSIREGMEEFAERAKGYRDDFREKVTPRPDWLVVTVDYHS